MGTDIQNYREIIECIYGEGVTTFNTNSQETNNIIGALNNLQYYEFSKNFIARLKRIAKSINNYSAISNFALKAVNEVASTKNWDGAYAELTALDFFISTKINLSELETDKSSNACMTMASYMGMSNVDHDFFIKDLDTYIDVKILSDKTGQILKSIIKEAIKEIQKETSIKNLRILPFYDGDISYLDVQNQRNEIIKELVYSCTKITKSTEINSQLISSLKFSIVLSPGIYFGENEYNPAKHAREHSYLIFQHAKKFHLKSPSLIMFVHFPWASETIPPIGNANICFYKKLASNFFYGSQFKNVEAKEINKKFSANIPAIDVTRSLAGIIFLEDKCILGDGQKENNMDAYFYINRNYPGDKVTGFVDFIKEYAKNLCLQKLAEDKS